MQSKIKPCRNCGSSEWYTQETRLLSTGTPSFLRTFLFAAVTEVYVCGGCGLIEFFVPSGDMDRVKEKLQRKT